MKYVITLLGCIATPCLAGDPFENFHEYGDLSEAEIHQLHSGELLYGDTEFGFTLSRGNTKSTAFKLKSNIYQDFEWWRNQFKFDGVYRRDTDKTSGEDKVSAERAFVSAQGNYKLANKRASFFVYSDYEQDRFNGFEYKTTVATGYGNRIYQGSKNTVDFDIGPGLYQSKTEEDVALAEGEEREQRGYLLRLAMQWERLISTRTRFNQDVSIEHSLSGLNSRLKSETALISQVLGGVSLKAAYIYRYNSQPADEKQSRDSELGVTLVYSF
ncbi:YdiY family protein [Pseudoalteromonas fenneropenaei]|uniref:YdiY family protein n=1 Tax=Pseudoalteromonas fenneropenaei TaxID=1737459 RepID=A0ABV7CHA1_9GAMM